MYRKALTTVIDSDYLGAQQVDVAWIDRHGEGSQRPDDRDFVWLSGKRSARWLPGDHRQARDIADRGIEFGNAGGKRTWAGGLPLQSRPLWHSR